MRPKSAMNAANLATGWNRSCRNQSHCVGCAVVVQQNYVSSSLVAQSTPVRQQVTGKGFCVVLCGIQCPVNLHQLRPAILKCHLKILPPPQQAPRCSISNSAWLPMPHTRCLPSPRCRNKQCWRFDTVNFDTWKWVTVSLTGLTFNATLSLTVCDCQGIALVAFSLNGWHLLKYLGMESID